MLDKIGINPTSLLAQVINFGLLFFILTRLLYKPVLRLFEERAKKIAQGLQAAEDNLKEKEKLEESKKLEMHKTRTEMEKLFTKAKEEAKVIGAEIVKKAQEEAKKEAEKEYQKLTQRLYEEEKLLKGKVSKLVIELTKKTLTTSLDQTTQNKIFTSQLKKLKKVAV
jgi:F-type H+-transporting ATPase subunit b